MNKALIFLLGVGIGGGTTWLLLKEYYHRLADDEIESVVSRYREPEKKEPAQNEEEQVDKKVFNTYTNLTKNYSKPSPMDYAAKYQNVIKEKDIEYAATEHPEDDDEASPYVISPEEFGELDDYDKISLTYYADGYLVEGDLGIIDDVDAVVGPDALDSFGEYEEDAVYVRNDQHKADYEILLSEMNYHEEI